MKIILIQFSQYENTELFSRARSANGDFWLVCVIRDFEFTKGI